MEVVVNDTWLPIRDASCGARHTVVVACIRSVSFIQLKENGTVLAVGSNESG